MVNDFGVREDLLDQASTVEWLRGLNDGAGTKSVRIAVDDAADQLGEVMTVILPDGTIGLLRDVLQTIKSQGASGLTGVGTYAQLIALSPQPAPGTLVQVGNDPDPLKNGTYRKDASGPDGWVKTADRTDQLAIQVADHENRLDAIEQDIITLDFAQAAQFKVINSPISNPSTRYTTAVVSGNLVVTQIVTGFPFLIGYLTLQQSPASKSFRVKWRTPTISGTGGDGFGICWNPSSSSTIDGTNFVGIIWRTNGLVAAYRADGTTLVAAYTAPGAASGIVIGNDVPRTTLLPATDHEMMVVLDDDRSTGTFTLIQNGLQVASFKVAGLPIGYLGAIGRGDSAKTATHYPAITEKVIPWSRNFYIDPSVGSSGAGTEKSPFKTLRDAIAKAEESNKRLDLVLKGGIFLGTIDILSNRYDHIRIVGDRNFKTDIKPGTMLTTGWTKTPGFTNVWERPNIWNGVVSIVANGSLHDYSQPDGFWGFTTYTRLNPTTGSLAALDAMAAATGAFWNGGNDSKFYVKTKNNVDPNTLSLFRSEYYAGINLAPASRAYIGHTNIDIAGIRVFNPYAHGIRTGRVYGQVQDCEIWGPGVLNGIATDMMSGEIASVRCVRAWNDGLNHTLSADFAPVSAGGTGDWPEREAHLRVIDVEATDCIIGDGFSPHAWQRAEVIGSRFHRNGKCGFVPVGNCSIISSELWDNVVGIQALPDVNLVDPASTWNQVLTVRNCDLRRNATQFLNTTVDNCTALMDIEGGQAIDGGVLFGLRNDTSTGGTTTNPCQIQARNVRRSGNTTYSQFLGGAHGQIGYLTDTDSPTATGQAQTDLINTKLLPLANSILVEAAARIAGIDLVAHFATPGDGVTPGRVMGGFGADMLWHLFKGLDIAGTGGAKILPSTDPDESFALIAGNGRIILKKTKSGIGDIGFATSSALSGTALGADIVHIILYGQSLGEGAEALPVTRASETGHNGKRADRGVRTWRLDTFANNPTGRPAFSLVPLTEVQDGATGETSATAMVATLKEFLVGPNSPAPRNGGPIIIVSFAGRGGRFLDELKKSPIQPDPDGKYYDTTIDDVRRFKAIADSLNKTYAVAGFMWWQGEANGLQQRVRGGPTLPYPDAVNFYRDDLIQLSDDLHTDVQAITHQAGRIPFWTYQTGAGVAAAAQILASEKAPTKIFLLGPTSHVPSAINSRYISGGQEVHGADVHLTADGEDWSGSNYGKGIYRHLAGREQVLAVKRLFARKIDARTIDVTFAVPRPPLRFDTTFWPAQGAGLGFKVYYGSLINGDTPSVTYLNGPAITGVKIIDTDTVRLSLASDLDITKLATIGYAVDRVAATLVGAVVDWRTGATLPNGQASRELEIAGAIPGVVTQLLSEGAFYTQNQTTGTAKTWIARSASLVGSNMVLLGEARDIPGAITPATAFVAGNVVNVARVPTYGNLFDSDNAISPLRFTDSSYGTRQGLNYPLGNPALGFIDLEVQV